MTSARRARARRAAEPPRPPSTPDAPTGSPLGDADDKRLPAAVDLLGRTGAAEFQVRYCDEDGPVIWLAAARWGKHWEAAGAMTPLLAVFRLCDEVIDGGQCQHCHRPTGFAPDLDTMPLDAIVCWYQYDPERSTFRRGCEGDT
jgi:hypothetical protein